jgi:hypothetical protein
MGSCYHPSLHARFVSTYSVSCSRGVQKVGKHVFARCFVAFLLVDITALAQNEPSRTRYPESGSVVSARIVAETVGSVAAGVGSVGSLKRWVYHVDCGGDNPTAIALLGKHHRQSYLTPFDGLPKVRTRGSQYALQP